MNILRANMGLTITLVLIIGVAVILATTGLFMKRADASLKPLWWLAGFFALIIAPQLLGHLYNAFSSGAGDRVQERPVAVAEPGVSPEASRSADDPLDPELLFGSLGKNAVVGDGSTIYGDVLAEAQKAVFIELTGGETVLLARFTQDQRARQAVEDYLHQSGLDQRAQGEPVGGYFAPKGASEFVHVRAVGGWFSAVSSAGEEGIQALLRAPGFFALVYGNAPMSTLPAADSQQEPTDRLMKRLTATPARLTLVIVLSIGYLMLVALYFFKGIAWATRVDPEPSVAAVPAELLKQRILQINELDAPFEIRALPASNEIEATWRYADAKWVDLARAHGMKRLHKILLELDPDRKIVRATDFATAYNWSAGAEGARLDWSFITGVVFFQYEHSRELGLFLDPEGRFGLKTGYQYTFSLKEMKDPLIQSVTRAGWRWQPVAWNAPDALRWLTE